MTETWKKRGTILLRGGEILLAVVLIAVLTELVLVLVNSDRPVTELRFVRSSAPPPPPQVLVPAELPPVAPPANPPVPAAPAPKPPPVVLLDFENLRRLLGINRPAAGNPPPRDYTASGNGQYEGGQGAVPGRPLVVVAPVLVPATNLLAYATNSASPTNQEAPVTGRTPATNRVSAAAGPDTPTGSAAPVFRISVP